MEKELPSGKKTYAVKLFFLSSGSGYNKLPLTVQKGVEMNYEITYNFDRLYEAYKNAEGERHRKQM